MQSEAETARKRRGGSTRRRQRDRQVRTIMGLMTAPSTATDATRQPIVGLAERPPLGDTRTWSFRLVTTDLGTTFVTVAESLDPVAALTDGSVVVDGDAAELAGLVGLIAAVDPAFSIVTP